MALPAVPCPGQLAKLLAVTSEQLTWPGAPHPSLCSHPQQENPSAQALTLAPAHLPSLSSASFHVILITSSKKKPTPTQSQPSHKRFQGRDILVQRKSLMCLHDVLF